MHMCVCVCMCVCVFVCLCVCVCVVLCMYTAYTCLLLRVRHHQRTSFLGPKPGDRAVSGPGLRAQRNESDHTGRSRGSATGAVMDRVFLGSHGKFWGKRWGYPPVMKDGKRKSPINGGFERENHL